MNEISNVMKKIPCAVYMRFSSNNQSDTSIEFQRNELLKYCSLHNYEIKEEFVDEAQTGTNDRRKAFQRMIGKSEENPEWETILIYNYSRFSRNLMDSLFHIIKLQRMNIQVISISEALANDLYLSMIQQLFIFSKNQEFSISLSKTTFDAMKNKALKHRTCGGIPPLGYDFDKEGQYVINEAEAEIVRKIFDMYEKGFSYHKMATYLNSEGYKTKVNGDFSKNSFRSILLQEKYIGRYVWNKRAGKNKLGERNNHLYKPQEEHITAENNHEAIISKEQFERVQKLIHERSGGKASNKGVHYYLLGGMKKLKCAECGRYMVGEMRTSHNRKYMVYSCPNHKEKKCSTKEIKAEYLNEFVIRSILINLMKRTDIDEINEALAVQDVNKSLLKKQKRLENTINNLVGAIEQSGSETLVNKLIKLEAEKQKIDEEMKMNTAPIYLTKDNFKYVRTKLKDYIIASEDITVRNFLMEIISTITVNNEEITVELNV